MTLAVTHDNLWQTAFKSCEATLSLLSLLKEDNVLVKDAMKAVEELIKSQSQKQSAPTSDAYTRPQETDVTKKPFTPLSKWSSNRKHNMEDSLTEETFSSTWQSVPFIPNELYNQQQLAGMTILDRQRVSTPASEKEGRSTHQDNNHYHNNQAYPNHRMPLHKNRSHTKEHSYPHNERYSHSTLNNSVPQRTPSRYQTNTNVVYQPPVAQEPKLLTEADLQVRHEDLVLNDLPHTMGVHVIYHPEQLSCIPIPTEKYVCLVSYQKLDGRLKVLQLFLMTSTKVDAYLIRMDRLYEANKDELKISRLGYFLTSREVSRGIWELEYIQNTLLDLGIGAGPSVNLPMVIKMDSGHELSLASALHHYMPGWKDLETFKAKEQAARSMPRSLWQEKEIPRPMIEYSAFEGLALGKVYKFIYDKSRAGSAAQ
ncbi:hypothetical protein BY458DRAFT_502773 [Sporodiniella umbellata]|nr:hypothetical protein BY458DRAFT_502773 [Sporodiniella umbellata]